MNLKQLLSRGFSLEKLNSFLRVVQSPSITAAAEGVQSRRSLMSRQIRELEETLGAELFYRDKKKLILTEFGRKFALTTSTYFSEVEDLLAIANNEHRVLRIGAGESSLEALVFPNLKKLREQFPQTQFDFVSRSTADTLRLIRSGELDAGIVRSDIRPPGLKLFNCGSLDFVCVARRDFEPRIEEWSMRQFLSRASIAILRGEGQFVSGFQQICREMDLDPRIEAKAGSFGQVRDLIIGGCSGVILPRVMAEKLPMEDFILLKDPALVPLERTLALVIDERVAKVRDGMEQEFRKFTSIIGGTRVEIT